MTESIKEYKKQKYFNKDIGEIEAIQFDGTVECAHAIYDEIISKVEGFDNDGKYFRLRIVNIMNDKPKNSKSINVYFSICCLRGINVGYMKWVWLDKDNCNLCLMDKKNFKREFKIVE